MWKREESEKIQRETFELSSEVSSKIGKIQFIRDIRILISNKRIRNNESSFFIY